MSIEKKQGPAGLVLDAHDAISDAYATLELLFYAGEGMGAVGIVRGAADAQARLKAAQGGLEALQVVLACHPDPVRAIA